MKSTKYLCDCCGNQLDWQWVGAEGVTVSGVMVKTGGKPSQDFSLNIWHVRPKGDCEYHSETLVRHKTADKTPLLLCDDECLQAWLEEHVIVPVRKYISDNPGQKIKNGTIYTPEAPNDANNS